MKRNLLVLFVMAIFLSLTTILAFSQQLEPEEEPECESCSEDLEEKWVLGEVKDVDLDSNQLTLVYVDYDINEQKEITITVDEDTQFEGIREDLPEYAELPEEARFDSLEDIYVGQVMGISYNTDEQGEDIALKITLDVFENYPEL